MTRNARRARRACSELRPATGWRREALRALEATLSGLRGERRAELLLWPDMRAWLAAAEETIALLRPRLDDVALFDRIARGPHLAEVVPRGRLDAGFRRRAGALGLRLLEKAFLQLPALLAFLTPAGRGFGPFPLDLEEDGEEARARGEIHLRFPLPATLELGRGARLELVGGGIGLRQRHGAPAWRPRETIEGCGIVLARRVISTRRGLRPGGRVAGLSQRLGEALRLIGEAWEEAHREVLAHTFVVVPLVEKGTVSCSLPDRPGTSYITVQDKSLVDLADDLLHETAHHRLHGLEELGPLDRDDGEPRYHSPWRRSLRPLRGILHATYTFAWRAELLSRMLSLRGPLPRAWIRKEIVSERAALRKSVGDLADAKRRGLLTPAGERLLGAIAARVW